MRRRILWAAMVLTSLVLVGCGQKGPLYREAGPAVEAAEPVAPQNQDDEDRQSPAS